MVILGIGMPELVFIIVIALIVLGPKDMQKAGRTIGKFMRNVVTSDGWKAFMQTSREIRTLPNRLMREANDEINKIGKEINASDPTRTRFNTFDPPSLSKPSPPKAPASVVPPVDKGEITPSPIEDETPKDDREQNA